MKHSELVMLMLMSTIWGLTWIAVKIGVETTPPIFFAATRFLAAGLILLLIFRTQIDWAVLRARWARLTIVSLLLTTLCYGPLFWGMQYTPSGLAGVVNLALMPVGLLAFGAMLRVESFSYQKSVGVVLGVAGLLALFAPKLEADHDVQTIGIAAITLGTFMACIGSVLMRKWFGDQPVGGVSVVIVFLGGMGLAALSAVLEPLSWDTWRFLGSPKALASWAFLVIFGSLLAFTIYLHLLTRWNPTRVGLYAFISPIIALAAGHLFLGEHFEIIQLVASALLLAAAAIIVAPERISLRPMLRR